VESAGSAARWAQRVFKTAPLTTIYAVSTALFWAIASTVANQAVLLVLFYLFALPSYLISLGATVIGISQGWRPSVWVAVGMCVAGDLTLNLSVAFMRWIGTRS